MKAEILRGAEKLSLDIPVTEQKTDVDQIADLMDPGKSLVSKLGIFGVEINEQLADALEDLRIPSGVVVAAMSADLAGVDADLKPGDVIHAVNGKKIETLNGLRAALNALPSGASGVLQVERDSSLLYITFEMD